MDEFTFDLQRFATEVSTLDALKAALTNGGEIKLTANIDTGTESLTIDKTVTLDLNGFNLQSNQTSDNKSFYTIKVTAGTLTIEDTGSSETKGSIGNTGMTSGYIGSVIYVASGASLNLTSGKIDASDTWSGGVQSYGTFTMSGGDIEAENTDGLGAVQVDASVTFTMSGGSITGKGSGLGVLMSNATGTAFTMTGGTIYSENRIGVDNNSGTFNMSGGTITAVGTEGATGSATMGVHVYGNGTFTMSAGEINSTYGGGVLCGSYGDTNPTAGTFTMNGGTITVNGEPTDPVGVFVIGDGSTFTMENGTIKAPNQLCVSVYGQGSGTYTDASKKNSFVMNGGTLEGDNGVAMYEGAANFNISGGSITATGNDGSAAVYVSEESEGSTVEISGGTVTATGESAMAVDNESSGTVNITGGTIKVTGDESLTVYNNSEGTVNISGDETIIDGSVDNEGKISITGGTFTDASYIPAGYVTKSIQGGGYTVMSVAQIGNTEYTTLANAIAAAQSGDTITLLQNVKLTETLEIGEGKTVTLDLNGKTLQLVNASEVDQAMVIYGILTVTDNSEDEQGKITSTGQYIIQLSGNNNEDIEPTTGKLTLQKGTIEGNSATIIDEETGEEYLDSTTVINVTKNGSFVMNGGNIIGNGGQAKGVWVESGIAKISNGTITVTDTNTYTDEELNEEGFAGACGVFSDSAYSNSKITISGGTIEASGSKVIAVSNEVSGAVEVSGTASISAKGEGSTALFNKYEGAVEINGGTINGAVTNSGGNLAISGNTAIDGPIINDQTGTIGTVTINNADLEEPTENKATATIDGNQVVFIGTTRADANQKLQNFINNSCGAKIDVTTGEGDDATISTTYYETLYEAVEAIQRNTNNPTVTLLKDASGGGIKVQSGTNFTLDFDDYTYNVTNDAVGSSGTQTQAFQLLKDSTIIFKNGTITSTAGSGVKRLIQNYSNLTLESMTLDGTHLDGGNPHYVMSNNNGNTRLTGSTSITAQDGDYAFDVYFWPKGSYTGGAQVTVNTTGTITGKIEVARDSSSTESKGKLTITQGTINGDVNISDAGSTIAINGGTIRGKIDNKSNKFTVSSSATINNADNSLGVAYIENGTTTTYYQTLQDAVTAATDENTIVVIADNVTLTETLTIASNKNITLDLNGKTITEGSNHILVSGENAVLTIKDSTAPENEPTVSNDYKTITYNNVGEIKATGRTLRAQNGGKIVLESGKIISGDVAVTVGAQGTTNKGTFEMSGGFIEAQEMCVLTIGEGSSANISGGVLHSKDNAVIADNGSNGASGTSGTTVTVSGGTLIGNIETSSYASCGIYRANKGKLTVSGGTIVSTAGAGIVARAGSVEIKDNATIIGLKDPNRSDPGKVGDSQITIPQASAVVFDEEADYPGLSKDSTNPDKVTISGGTFTGNLVFLPKKGTESTSNLSDRFTVSDNPQNIYFMKLFSQRESYKMGT